MDLNRVQLIGRSGANAELKYTQSGMAVLNLSIATSRNMAKQGEPANWQSTWHRVSVWGKRAESIAAQIKKGTTVYVEGEISTREWEDKGGQKKTSTEINARHVEVIHREAAPQQPQQPQNEGYARSFDDVPF